MTATGFPYRICIPYPDRARGGMYTFFSHFTNYLDAHRIGWTRSWRDRHDILFLNSFMTPRWQALLSRLFRPQARIVHRLDGSAQDYGRTNGPAWDQRQVRINRLADLTIFQSEYGKRATREIYRLPLRDGPVIPNPVDTGLFSPPSSRPCGPARLATTSFSTNPKKGGASILELARRNPDLAFLHIGPADFTDAPPNLTATGPVGRDGVADHLRTCHAFVFFSENETCSNAVLEALASGLPVFYLDSGGTGELVADAGWPVTIDSFRSAWDAAAPALSDTARRARSRAVEHYSIDVILPRYLDTMRTLFAEEGAWSG